MATNDKLYQQLANRRRLRDERRTKQNAAMLRRLRNRQELYERGYHLRETKPTKK